MVMVVVVVVALPVVLNLRMTLWVKIDFVRHPDPFNFPTALEGFKV